MIDYLSVDILTQKQRSDRMRLVKSKGTGPERLLRGLIRGLGYRFRSHLKTLPGSPDFVFPELRKVIFVHGCFWHQHSACRKDRRPRSPKSRLEYWQAKLLRNRRRDLENQRQLKRMGWSYLVVWECRFRSKANAAKLLKRVESFLGKPSPVLRMRPRA